MRKIMMMVVALVAMTFVSCGQKSVNNVEASDSSTVVTTEEAGEIAKAAIEELKSNIDAKDANAVQEAITSIQEKVKEYIHQSRSCQSLCDRGSKLSKRERRSHQDHRWQQRNGQHGRHDADRSFC